MPDKTTPHIEKAARAMCVNRVPDNIDGGPHPGGPWLDEGEPWWTGYIEQATFALRTTLEPSEAEIMIALRAYSGPFGTQIFSITERQRMKDALVAVAQARITG
jgi:hypothetical protein